MHQYIQDTQFSASQLIDLIFADEKSLADAEAKRSQLQGKADFHYKVATWKEDYGEFDPYHVVHEYNKMIDASSKAAQGETEILKILGLILAKEFSIGALSGALLQIAKQGISVVHGGLSNCPDGRSIGGEPLKNIVWQGRNQSMHYEEGNPHQPVRSCFQNLEVNCGPQFALATNPPRNLARNVIDVLGWKTYQQYETDMISLLG